MFLTTADYANNEDSLLRVLKRQQKGTRHKYKDVEAKINDRETTVLRIYYEYASNERGGWTMGVNTVWLDSQGLMQDSLLNSQEHILSQWVEHIKNIKQYRIMFIKKELIEKAMSPHFGPAAAKN